MPKFCYVYPWCSPAVYWAMAYGDYRRLKPTVDHLTKQEK